MISRDATQQRPADLSNPSTGPVHDVLSRDSARTGNESDGLPSSTKESQAVPRIAAKPQRAMAALGQGRSIIVIGRNLTIDSWIKTLQEALGKARRAKAYGLHLDSFLKMLRDMSGR